jgi:hypothetical protein
VLACFERAEAVVLEHRVELLAVFRLWPGEASVARRRRDGPKLEALEQAHEGGAHGVGPRCAGDAVGDVRAALGEATERDFATSRTSRSTSRRPGAKRPSGVGETVKCLVAGSAGHRTQWRPHGCRGAGGMGDCLGND